MGSRAAARSFSAAADHRRKNESGTVDHKLDHDAVERALAAIARGSAND